MLDPELDPGLENSPSPAIAASHQQQYAFVRKALENVSP